MRSIWKFPIRLAQGASIEPQIPKGATPVFVGMQGADVCAWFEIETANKSSLEAWRLEVHGTGHMIEDAIGTYIGSAQQFGVNAAGAFDATAPQFVWHVYGRKIG